MYRFELLKNYIKINIINTALCYIWGLESKSKKKNFAFFYLFNVHKEGWTSNNWCFLIVVLEKTLESLLDSKEIQPVHPKGNQPWIFIGRTDAEAEASKPWSPDEKNWLIWKDPDAGNDWRWEEKGMTEDELVEWHHRINGHEFG